MISEPRLDRHLLGNAVFEAAARQQARVRIERWQRAQRQADKRE
jgi:hypothetical protein